MLTLPIDHLVKNLDTFLSYGIKPENIFRDLGAFRSSQLLIECRLNKLKEVGIKKLMPWMIRYSDFNGYIERAVEEKNALGGHDNTCKFLINRLNLKQEIIDEMIRIYPRIAGRKARMVRLKF